MSCITVHFSRSADCSLLLIAGIVVILINMSYINIFSPPLYIFLNIIIIFIINTIITCLQYYTVIIIIVKLFITVISIIVVVIFVLSLSVLWLWLLCVIFANIFLIYLFHRWHWNDCPHIESIALELILLLQSPLSGDCQHCFSFCLFSTQGKYLYLYCFGGYELLDL